VSLILKRASASRSSGEWKAGDYDVLADGQPIGRIYDDGSAGTLPKLRRFWSIIEIVRVPGTRSMLLAGAPQRLASNRALS
jgi:hypothetical protein